MTMKSVKLLFNVSRPIHTVGRFYHKSKYAVEIEDCTVSDYMLNKFEKHCNKTALVDGHTGTKWTFGRLIDETHQLSENLTSRGMGRGDVACLCGTNAPEFAHVFGGVTSSGMALTIANAQLTIGELEHQIQETNSKLLFVTPDCADKARQVKERVPTLQDIIVLGEQSGCIQFVDLVKPLRQRDKPRDTSNVSGEDIALIPFSSGTTGVPKGVMLTHRNLVAQLSALSHPTMLPFREDDQSLSVLPMVHIAGLVIGMLNPLCQGATVVTLPRFKPDDFLATLQKHRISFSLIAPPVVSFLANDPLVDQYDVTSFRNPYSGAAPLGRELTEAMVERLHLSGIRQAEATASVCLSVATTVKQIHDTPSRSIHMFISRTLTNIGYGMSEASPALTTTPLDGWKYGSVGVPLPNTECKVVDIDTGATLGAYQNGEIWSRGPQVMKGYLNNPVATSIAITSDKWLKTGDIGYYDKDGHYFIVDRLKEIIKYKGYQVAPAYLESILLTHPDVEDAAVVGVPHEVYGHLPRAFVVCRKTRMEKSIAQYVNDQVAPYKRLRGGVIIVDQLPRSPSGKILRRELV